jgi:hypothetical protein
MMGEDAAGQVDLSGQHQEGVVWLISSDNDYEDEDPETEGSKYFAEPGPSTAGTRTDKSAVDRWHKELEQASHTERASSSSYIGGAKSKSKAAGGSSFGRRKFPAARKASGGAGVRKRRASGAGSRRSGSSAMSARGSASGFPAKGTKTGKSFGKTSGGAAGSVGLMPL